MTIDLVTARVNRGLTLNQAAKEIGVARATLQRVERGVAVHPASAKKVADYYGVKAADLIPVTPPNGVPA